MIGDIETEYSCSGICAKKDYYYFSDVDRGVPLDMCIVPIRDQMLMSEFGGYGVGFIIFAVLICVPCLLQIPLFFLPGRGNIGLIPVPIIKSIV